MHADLHQLLPRLAGTIVLALAPVVFNGVASLAYAGDAHRDRDARPRPADSSSARPGMQAVLTTAGPGEPGHGWRYFSDPVAATAVVISPQGEHFFSRGEGLRPIAVGQPTP
jgi:hypothetical protein